MIGQMLGKHPKIAKFEPQSFDHVTIQRNYVVRTLCYRHFRYSFGACAGFRREIRKDSVHGNVKVNLVNIHF
jgi:hypothetical protein